MTVGAPKLFLVSFRQKTSRGVSGYVATRWSCLLHNISPEWPWQVVKHLWSHLYGIVGAALSPAVQQHSSFSYLWSYWYYPEGIQILQRCITVFFLLLYTHSQYLVFPGSGWNCQKSGFGSLPISKNDHAYTKKSVTVVQWPVVQTKVLSGIWDALKYPVWSPAATPERQRNHVSSHQSSPLGNLRFPTKFSVALPAVKWAMEFDPKICLLALGT